MVEKEDFGNAGYVLGIVSIVMAFFTPLAGLIFGIIGLKFSRDSKALISKKGQKLNKIGIIISAILLVVTIVMVIVGANISNFPIR